jgi:hypothetical protein
MRTWLDRLFRRPEPVKYPDGQPFPLPTAPEVTRQMAIREETRAALDDMRRKRNKLVANLENLPVGTQLRAVMEACISIANDRIRQFENETRL